MPSTASYHSVSNVETEGTPDLEHQSNAQRPQIDNEINVHSDSEWGRSSRIKGSTTATLDPKYGEHAKGFRLSPGFIDQESWGIKVFSWTWEIVLTALPLFFIAVSILALQLDQKVKSSSEYGVRLEEITRLGPTIYPILFAMVVARFYRNVARWHLERPGGITVSSLEQIVGSQSFASALERLIIVRAQLLLGALILLSWAMSPLGGQSLLRLLYIDEKVSKANGTVYYDNRAYQRPLYFDMDRWTYGPSDVIPALYSTSLLSPRKQQQAPMDTWGRPKIPQWPLGPAQDIEKAEETSREVNGSALEAGRDYYTSLIGINMQGLSFSNNSTQYEFNFESGYIDFNCFMVTNQASLDDLEKMTYPEDGNSTGGNLWKDWSVYWETQKKEPSFNAVTVSPASLFDDPYLLYATQQVSEDRNKHAVFNCTTARINLRTSLICTTQGCRPQRQRRIRALQMSEGDLDRRLTAFRNAVREWPQMTAVVTGSASATDNYIANDENAYGPQYAQNWTGIDNEIFSRRLTAAFNTVWEAGSDEYNLTKSSSALPENPADLWTNRTDATITTTEPAYYVNRLWAVILILTTTFLQLLAICGLVLRCLIRGPDILGFASSLTRDNAFVPVLGGSFQGGAERARSLGKMRVQLADIQPRESRGYIALSAVPPVGSAGAGDKAYEEEGSLGQLKEKRMYM